MGIEIAPEPLVRSINLSNLKKRLSLEAGNAAPEGIWVSLLSLSLQMPIGASFSAIVATTDGG